MKLIVLSVVGGVLFAAIISPLAFGFNQIESSADSIFDSIDTTDLSSELSTQTTLYANDGETVLAKFYAQNRIVVPIDRISKHLQNAVVAREDRRFFKHKGVDLIGTIRAASTTILSKATGDSETQGGSTLTQQYVKNLLIDHAIEENDPMGVYEAKEQSLMRKIKEAKYAFEVEQKMTKTQILEGYLNVAPFGPNTYGAEASSQHYFSKSAADLTVSEAALIAAITKSPAVYDPIYFPKNAKEQRDITLKLMLNQGYINKDEYNEAVAVEINDMLHPKDIAIGCGTAGGAGFFCDWVVNSLLNDPFYGSTKSSRARYLYNGSLNIYTTLDKDWQSAAEEALVKRIPKDDSSGLADAVTTVEPGTGKVLAMAQNRDYDAAATGADKTKTAVNYNVGLAEGGSIGFSPGSIFKPIVFAAWLRDGHSLNEELYDVKDPFPISEFACYNGIGEWDLTNANGSKTVVNPLNALLQSLNVPIVHLGKLIGLCSIADTAKLLGFTDSRVGDITNPDNMFPVMIIGGVNATPLNMASVYATFAADGVKCNPIGITKIVDGDGVEKPVPDANCHRVLDEDVANTMMWLLRESVDRGLARGLNIPGFDVGGKTGTADDAKHLWGAGFIKQAASVAWAGGADKDISLRGAKINGVTKSIWYGLDIPLPIIRDQFNAVIKAKDLHNESFPDADERLTRQIPAPEGSCTDKVIEDCEQDKAEAEARAAEEAALNSATAPGSKTP